MFSIERDLFADHPTKPSIPTKLNTIMAITLGKTPLVALCLNLVKDLMPMTKRMIGKNVTLRRVNSLIEKIKKQ